MNKKKRTLVFYIVSLSVFCLSAIFTTFKLLPSFQEETTPVNAVSAPETDETVAEINNIEVQSFSYKKDVITENDDKVTTQKIKTDTKEAKETLSSKDNADTMVAPTVSPAAATSKVKEVTAKAADKSNIKKDTSKELTSFAISTADKAVAKEPVKTRYANIGISVANDFVNIRKEASTDSDILGKLYKDSAATILKEKGDWYLVESGSLKGYIKKEFLKTGIPDKDIVEKYGELRIIVAVDGLNVRETTDTESSKLDVIYQNEVYPVVELKEDWVKINVEDDNVCGYVKREFTELIVKFKEAVSKEEEQELLRLQAEERAKKETEIKHQEGVNYSSQDLKLLACLVHAEAGTQSYEGKLAVANVVLNRVKSSDYPNTIKAVIYQSGQFSVAHSGSLDKQLSNYDNYSSNAQELSIKAAREALEGENNVGSRKHFNSYRSAVNKGYDEIDTAVKIGDQLFW